MGGVCIDRPVEDYEIYPLDFVFGKTTINIVSDKLIQKYQWDAFCVLRVTNTAVLIGLCWVVFDTP